MNFKIWRKNTEKNCIFCDRTKLEEHIIAENDGLYITATLGQITNGGYILIIPKEHVSCIGAMKEIGIIEIDAMSRIVSSYIEIEYGVKPIIFEHGIIGQTIQHAHLHILPANIRMCNRIYKDLPNSQVCFLDSLALIKWTYDVFSENKYILWSTPEGLIKAIIDPVVPPQYLRIVAAKLLGRPERANWRNMDPELDKRLCQETISRLKSYF